MIWNVIGLIVAIIYIIFNVFIAKRMSAKSMKREFVEGQCFVGKVFANIFYAPAWLLKGIKAVVMATIA